MKLLQKMLLLNWHYFHDELIEFKQINFLTGKNSSGKTTMIDALQLMMLGDTSGYYFNKAASDRSNRTLKGYLRGEVSEDEDSTALCLRSNEDFSSYIVLEFKDTAENRSFCLGIVFDTYADGNYRHQFFYLKAPLPAHRFCPEGVCLNLKALKGYLHNHYAGKFQFFDTNRDYREVMAGVLGHLNEKFFRLFRKAVPFSPIMDIKGFITEFVCELDSVVDITHMQENIRQYKQLEEELGIVEKKIYALEEIGKKYQVYREEAERYRVQSYLLDRAEVEKNRLALEETRHEIKVLGEKLRELKTQISRHQADEKELEKKRDELIQEKARSDLYRKQQDLISAKERLSRDLEEIENSENRLARILGDHYLRWREALKWCGDNLDKLDLEDLPSGAPVLEKLRLLEVARHGEPALLEDNPLQQLRESLQQYRSSLSQAHAALHNRCLQDASSARTLERELADLEKGIKPYAESLRELCEVIAAELGARYGSPVGVEILAELLEVKDPRWHNALEGYLHTRKFYLLVEPRYFVEALEIYDRLKDERKFYDIGLVDIERVQAANPVVMPGSLAEEIETDHPAARVYADYLLGRVIKCESVAELRRHNTAITPGGMLYQSFVARRLNPARWLNPYIGRRAIEAQMHRKQEELAKRRLSLHELTPRVDELEKIITLDPLTKNDISGLLELKEAVGKKDRLEEELKKVVEELGALDLSYLDQLEKKLDACRNEITGVRAQIDEKQKQEGKTERGIQYKEELLPNLEQALRGKSVSLTEQYPEKWRIEIGEPRFDSELERPRTPEEIIEVFTSSRKGTTTKRDARFNELVDLRNDYNRDFKGSFKVTVDNNSAFEMELVRLKDTMIVEYRTKINEARERAQIQFQEDFVSKLKANIDNVRAQIDDLNNAIRNTFFGRERYEFSRVPNPQYRRFYDMITDDLLLEGHTLFSQPFQEKHRDTVEELFRQIVDIGEGVLTADQRAQLQKNIEKFTDYRTYLDFDLISIDKEGYRSPLSRTLTKKSGGETQTPFYISVLASFMQLYRVNYEDSNTLRLIAFDEAYNKMDHQRIYESIKLTREMGLQVILSAATEKIADIAPYVDRNLCVTRVKNDSAVKAFDPRELEEMGV